MHTLQRFEMNATARKSIFIDLRVNLVSNLHFLRMLESSVVQQPCLTLRPLQSPQIYVAEVEHGSPALGGLETQVFYS